MNNITTFADWQQQAAEQEAVLLFSKGREFARFARFVPMESLKKRLDELEGMVCG